MHHIFNTNNALLAKLERNARLKPTEVEDLRHLPSTYLICYLNGFEEAKDQMDHARPLLKKHNRATYSSLKEALRVLRKVKYS